jgi:predicted amidophosphoribosyltransferase
MSERRLDLAQLHPRPRGFADCVPCHYWSNGDPAVCSACANVGAGPDSGPLCPLCRQPLVDSSCPNAVCRLPDPEFTHVWTVLERPEEMWSALWRYKYEEDKRWAEVLARLLVGFLDTHRAELERYDAITTCALYVGPQAARLWDYLRLIVDAAQRLGPEWPFVPDLITKAVPTGRFLGIGVEERRTIAEGELRSALAVPEPERVRGKRVLVFDDVYSEGYSMREMARVLNRAGAAEVAGLVLARRKGC